MEYLDPKKEFRHRILLFTGYICIAIAIVTASLVLVYQAYGFGLGKNGNVIQNGLVFFSSQPNPANIYLNGKLNKAKTNSRIVLPEGTYQVRLTREGYRDWDRKIELAGGNVEHFDYPFLIPTSLTPKKLQSYSAAPSLMTQSPDRRWLMVSVPDNISQFHVFDLKNPADPPEVISLPAGVLTAGSGESWQLTEWSTDNQHVLLRHAFEGKMEYMLVDRTSPEKSVNLSTTLGVTPTKLTLRDKKYDRYYLYDAATQTLRSATLGTPQPATVLTGVAGYQSYGDDTLLYATPTGAPTGKVFIKILIGQKAYTIRTLPVGSTYLLDLAKYSGALYVAAGVDSSDRVYVYKDPIGQLRKLPKQAPSPVQVLHVTNPNYVSFSASAQFVMAESAAKFGVYDIENETGHNYALAEPLDSPQLHANWMDGNRLLYTTGGQLRMVDYDYMNRQKLVAALPAYRPAIAPDAKYLYVLAPTPGSSELQLTQTPLLTPQDR